jgi:hypothetical protein
MKGSISENLQEGVVAASNIIGAVMVWDDLRVHFENKSKAAEPSGELTALDGRYR